MRDIENDKCDEFYSISKSCACFRILGDVGASVRSKVGVLNTSMQLNLVILDEEIEVEREVWRKQL